MAKDQLLKKLQKDYLAYDYKLDYVFNEAGMQINVPMVYKGASSSMYLMTANKNKVISAIGDNRIQPVSIMGGKTIVAINTFEYRDCEAGPFTEFTFSVPVMVGAKYNLPIIPLLADQYFEKFGFYVMQLGGSNSNSREHISRIWGYPTHNGDLNIALLQNEESLYSSVHDGDELIYKVTDSFTVNKKLRYSQKRFNTYFHTGDDVRHVTLNTFLVGAANYGINDKITLDLGSHPLSKKISDLDLGPIIASIYYPNAIEIASSYETL